MQSSGDPDSFHLVVLPSSRASVSSIRLRMRKTARISWGVDFNNQSWWW